MILLKNTLSYFVYYCKSTLKGGKGLVMGVLVPFRRVEVTGDVDLPGSPVGESALDRDLHRVSIKESKELSEFDLCSIEVVEESQGLSNIPVEPSISSVHK